MGASRTPAVHRLLALAAEEDGVVRSTLGAGSAGIGFDGLAHRLVPIPRDILDAAKVEGAGFFRTWHYVITPTIAAILFIGLIYDVTFTLGDITIVYVLTQGGPASYTQILPILAYQNGIVGENLSKGAADDIILFPLLFVGMVIFLRLRPPRDREALRGWV